MRWEGQKVGAVDAAALPGMERLDGLVRSVATPEFVGITFHEVLCRTALNHVPGSTAMPFDWTINPYRGCSHACVYCFARGTHAYLGLDAGHDFESQIVVKVNVADALRRDLSARRWDRERVALGTNTDPYQRAEGRYRLMPGIIDALVDAGTPFSILTKGTLLRRDLPQLAAAASHVRVSVAMSIAVFDDALQHSLEPGTPTATARLATVRAAADAGFRVTVFFMPILPRLTDGARLLDDALQHSLEPGTPTGAAHVVFGALHLRPGVKPWFLQWLERDHPDLVPVYRDLYPGTAAYAPAGYRAQLAQRVRPLLRRHGLGGYVDDDRPRVARPSRAAASRVTSTGRTPESARLF